MRKHFCSKDYYKILGIKKGSTHKEIKNAFYLKAKHLHPDVTESM